MSMQMEMKIMTKEVRTKVLRADGIKGVWMCGNVEGWAGGFYTLHILDLHGGKATQIGRSV